MGMVITLVGLSGVNGLIHPDLGFMCRFGDNIYKNEYLVDGLYLYHKAHKKYDAFVIGAEAITKMNVENIEPGISDSRCKLIIFDLDDLLTRDLVRHLYGRFPSVIFVVGSYKHPVFFCNDITSESTLTFSDPDTYSQLLSRLEYHNIKELAINISAKRLWSEYMRADLVSYIDMYTAPVIATQSTMPHDFDSVDKFVNLTLVSTEVIAENFVYSHYAVRYPTKQTSGRKMSSFSGR